MHLYQNKFYFIKEEESSNMSIKTQIIFNPDHAIFEGHFPQQPVVPGVCMLQIVKELLEQQLKKQLIMHSGNQFKFLQPIIPLKDQVINVLIEYKRVDETGTNYQIQANFKNQNQILFKMQGTFAENE